MTAGRIIRLEATIYRAIRDEIARHVALEHGGAAEAMIDHEAAFFAAGGGTYRDLAKALLETLSEGDLTPGRKP
jgi:hypothetical protein